MMKINRAVVKQQAKDIIKGNVFKLFLITLIIGVLTGGGMTFSNTNIGGLDDILDRNPFSQNQDDNDSYDFDEFTTEFSDPFQGFDGNGKVSPVVAGVGVLAGVGALAAFWGFIISAASLLLSPLKIMLDGLFWQLIKGNNMGLGDGLGFIFKKTFDKNYLQKFLLELVQGLLLGLLYLLFIIPGIIFTYKWYFTSYILAEHPELSFDQAMNISKKMTNNHKGELFVLDLSFIGWFLLLIPTIGLAGIYVTPYYETTKALYYENFKIRAFQEGAITQYDFMTNEQKIAAGQAAPQMNTYAPAPQETYYVPAQEPVPQNNYYVPAEQPAPQPVAEPVVEAAPQPVVEPAVEPVSETVAEPAVEPVAEPQEAAPSPEYYTPTAPEQETPQTPETTEE